MNLADYNPNQQQKRPGQQPQPGEGGNLADFGGPGQMDYSAQQPQSMPAPNLGPQAYNPSTGTAGHINTGDIGGPPPMNFSTAGQTAPAPNLGPQTFNPATGTAGHQPAVGVQAPGLTPTPAANPADPFAAQGGGVQINGNWFPKDHPGAIEWMKNNPQAGGGAAPGSPSPAPAPGAAPTPAPGAPDPNAPYKDALLKMLGDSQTPASLNDPALKAQSDAFAVGQKRGSERDRAAAAEMASLNGSAGLSSGAFDSDISGINERAGENMAGFNAGLVGDANKAKLGQMQNALAMMGADKNSAEGRALQERIANTQAQLQRDQLSQQGRQFDVDADLRRLGITTQADLGGRDLSLRDKLGSGGLNLGLMQALMQNQQFGQGLGAQLGMHGASLNQNALLSLLGGL